MLSKPVALAVLAAGCMTAAAGGAYFAMRQTPVAQAPGAFEAQAVAVEPMTGQPPLPAATQAPAQAELAAPPQRVEPKVETARPAPAAPARRRPATRSNAPDTRRQAHTDTAPESTEPSWEPAPTAVAPLPETPIAAPVEPPAPQVQFQEVTIPSETVVGVQVETAVTSERARVEDRVEGRVTRDVAVGGRVAIPAGTRLIGSVSQVERGGKFKERARIAVRFHTAQLADGSRLELQTTAIVREGDSPSRESAAKVGGSAVGGAILGAILGGGKGAVIGGTAGAAGGTAVVMAGGRNVATLAAGTTATIRLMSDVTVTVER